MISRRRFLSFGARAVASAATTYAVSRLFQGNEFVPARPAVAGRLEYTVTSLADGITSPPISVILRPQGAPVAQATPTPFSQPASPSSQVLSDVPRQTAIASVTTGAAQAGFLLTVTRAENIDGASFEWDFGRGAAQRGASTLLKPDQAGSIHGALGISNSNGELARIPLVRLVAYDTPGFLASSRPHFGVQAHVNFDLPESLGGISTIPDVVKAIARVKELGMDVVRTDWVWDKVEKTPGGHNWNEYQYDDVIQLLASNGLGSLAILKGTPQWCSTAPDLPYPGWANVPPTDARLYGEYVYRFIDRYGATIKMIEVYQEPNVSLYWNFDAAGLAAMQREGFLHAKYANPNVAVGLTGLVGVPRAAVHGADGYWHYGTVLFEAPEVFLSRIYQATGGRSWWDSMGLHTYPDMELFSPSTGFNMTRSVAFINSIKSVMAAYGDASPLSVTEIGTCTPGDSPSPHAVAQFLGQLVDTIRQNTATPVLIWYRLNEGPNPSSPDDRRGLATYDLEHLTPVGQTMKAYVQQH